MQLQRLLARFKRRAMAASSASGQSSAASASSRMNTSVPPASDSAFVTLLACDVLLAGSPSVGVASSSARSKS
eukprot:11824340-Karenia_brevis.AAC.1